MKPKLFALALLFSLFVGAVAPAAPVPLVNHGDTWRYRKGTNAPQADWKTAADAGLDATWLTGNGGIGYADNATETQLCQTLLTDMANNYRTLYMRRTFTVGSPVDTSLHLQLTMDFDDGFIVWLDGVYLTNRLVTGAPTEPAFNALANTSHESSHGNSTPLVAEIYDFGAVGSRLPVGTHVLAIIGLNNTLNSSDLIQIIDLFLSPPPVPMTNTWRLVDSPIVVPSNVTIGALSTLIIEPGVTVQFGSGINLVIADGGTLLAVGTSNAPIHFTRSGASGNWGHITIDGSVGSPESKLVWADFQFNAASTGTPCIEVAAGTAFMDHLTFGNTGAPYIHVDGASFVISHCHFPTATAQFELVHGTAGIKGGGRGIFLRNFFGKANGYNDVVDFSGGNRPGPIVQFLDNVFTGSDDDALDLDSTDAWVEGNIFLHIHKNGAPDSSSGVSGGSDNASNSEITVLRNIFFDCDQAATAKQTNFYTFYNNTIVHQTHIGGLDSTGGVVNVRDTPDGGSPTSYGRGFYLEGNIVFDTEQLGRNYVGGQTSIIYSNNLLPFAWLNGGGGNIIGDPMFAHVPTLAETVFTNWDGAQILWSWLSLQPGSPAIATGPNGTDMGAVIAPGASISGEPTGTTTNTSATLRVALNRTGGGIPTGGFPNGSGYIAYKWRLDGGPWSAETPINTLIALNSLSGGTHQVDVTGKSDAGFYQDDPSFAGAALLSQSAMWTVQSTTAPQLLSASHAGNTAIITFIAVAGQTYSLLYRDAFDALHPWTKLTDIPAQVATGPLDVQDTTASGPQRFYRIVTPAQP